MLVFKCYLSASTRFLSSQGEVTNILEKLSISSEALRGRVLIFPVLWWTALTGSGEGVAEQGWDSPLLGDSQKPMFVFGIFGDFLLSQTHQNANDAFLMQREHGWKKNSMIVRLPFSIYPNGLCRGLIIHRMLPPTSLVPLSSSGGQKLRPGQSWPPPASPLWLAR